MVTHEQIRGQIVDLTNERKSRAEVRDKVLSKLRLLFNDVTLPCIFETNIPKIHEVDGVISDYHCIHLFPTGVSGIALVDNGDLITTAKVISEDSFSYVGGSKNFEWVVNHFLTLVKNRIASLD